MSYCQAITFFLFSFLFPFFSLYSSSPPVLRENGLVILGKNEVYNGDFFAIGRSVEIAGVVNGDVYVVGGQIIIDGTINGDLIAAGGSIDIAGKVSQSCRLGGGQILLSGEVGKNLSVLSGTLQILASAKVNNNLIAAACIIDTLGSIGSTATVVASTMRVSSHIHRNLQGYVGKLRITSAAAIDGDLDYRSDSPAHIDSGATIRGNIIYQPSLVHKIVNSPWIHNLFAGSKVLVLLMNFIYTFVIGALLIRIFPRNLEAALHSLNTHPLRCFLYGSLFVIFLPLLFVLLLITILGVPFALTLLAFNILGFYTAKIYSLLWISNWAHSKWGIKKNKLLCFFSVVVVYFGLTAIPFFGLLLTFTALLFGLGAGLIAQTKSGIFPRLN